MPTPVRWPFRTPRLWMSAGSYSPRLPRFTLKNFLARNAQIGTFTKNSAQCPMRSSRKTMESWSQSFGTFHYKRDFDITLVP